jgi:hypothetical protein
LVCLLTPNRDKYAPFRKYQETLEADDSLSHLASPEEMVAGSKRAADVLAEQGFAGVQSASPGHLATINPSNIRSQFARFDPRLSHLSNLSAANVSPTAGLLGSAVAQEQQALPFQKFLRGLFE